MTFPSMAPAKTAYSEPWALVLYGGADPTKRPSTRLAWITEAIAIRGHIVGYRAYTWSQSAHGWTKKVRRFEESEILYSWRSKPTEHDIQRIRKRLKPGLVA